MTFESRLLNTVRQRLSRVAEMESRVLFIFNPIIIILVQGGSNMTGTICV